MKSNAEMRSSILEKLDCGRGKCRTQAHCGRKPLAQGTHCAAIQALRHPEVGRTVGADGLSLESVECLPTLAALPEVADRRCGFARRTSKSVPARQLCEAQQRLRVSQSAPAIQQHEDGDHPEPRGMHPEGETDEAGHAQEAEDHGYHQASSASQHKPEQ